MKLKNKNDIKIAYTILQINPTAVFSISGDDVNKIEWLEGTTPISNEDILAKQIELQADYDAKQYQRDRVYPSIGEQLDMQYWDSVNGTTTWKDAVAKVKSDNPKS
jgi:hypothetical protein